MTTMNIFLKER